MPEPGFRRIIRVSRAICRPTGQGCGTPSAVRRRRRGRRAGVPPVRVRARTVPRPGHTGRGGHRRPRRGAPQRRGAGRARARRPGVRGARRPSPRARGPRVRRALRRPPDPAATDGPAHVRARLLGARAAPAARGDRVRGGALQQARAPRADPGARSARVPEPRERRARVRDPASIGVRMALPDRPVVAIVGDGSSLLRDPGALERGALRGGGGLRDPRQRGVHGHGPSRGAPGRSIGMATIARDRPLRARALVRLSGASCELVRRARGGVRRGRPGARRPRRAAVPRGRRRARLALRAVSLRPVGLSCVAEDDDGAAARPPASIRRCASGRSGEKVAATRGASDAAQRRSRNSRSQSVRSSTSRTSTCWISIPFSTSSPSQVLTKASAPPVQDRGEDAASKDGRVEDGVDTSRERPLRIASGRSSPRGRTTSAPKPRTSSASAGPASASTSRPRSFASGIT